MTHATVVFLGGPHVQTAALGLLMPEFGWSLEIASDLDALRRFSAAGGLVAVLFDADSLGLSWPDALKLVREAAPQALLIPCHRLSDRVNWPDLAESGAFHALALPFDQSEVRQSLGFVSFARSQLAANVLSISSLERLGVAVELSAVECGCGRSPCECPDATGPVGIRGVLEAR
jgi:hypothetical protein